MKKTGLTTKEFSLTLLLPRSLIITRTFLRSKPIEGKNALKKEIKAVVWSIIRVGELKVLAHISYAFKGIIETQKAFKTAMRS